MIPFGFGCITGIWERAGQPTTMNPSEWVDRNKPLMDALQRDVGEPVVACFGDDGIWCHPKAMVAYLLDLSVEAKVWAIGVAMSRFHELRPQSYGDA